MNTSKLVKSAQRAAAAGKLTDAEIAFAKATETNDPEALLAYGDYLIEHGRLRHALQSYESARAAAQETGDQVVVADALRGIASHAELGGDVAAAEHALTEAQAIYEQLDDMYGTHVTLLSLASLDTDRGNFKKAEEKVRESLDHFRNEGDDQNTVRSLAALGRIYGDRGDFETAHRYWREARDLARKSDDPVDSASIDISVGWALTRLGELDEAKTTLEAVEAFSKQRQLIGMRAEALHGLGDVEHERGNLDEAHRLLNQGLRLFTSVDDQDGTANTLKLLGDVEADRPNIDRAESYYVEALSIWNRTGSDYGVALVYESLAIMKADNGMHTEAAELYQAAASLYSSFGQDERAREALSAAEAQEQLARG